MKTQLTYSKRIYHLKQLRRDIDSVDLLRFYGSVIRPVLHMHALYEKIYLTGCSSIQISHANMFEPELS